MDSGWWAVVGGRLSMDSGRWAVVGGRDSVRGWWMEGALHPKSMLTDQINCAVGLIQQGKQLLGRDELDLRWQY